MWLVGRGLAVSKPALAAAGWGSGGNGMGGSTKERSRLGSHRCKSCLTLYVTLPKLLKPGVPQFLSIKQS